MKICPTFRKGSVISREDFIERIFVRSVKPLHQWVAPEELPDLGDEYPAEIERLRAQFNTLFEAVRIWLSEFEIAELEERFSPNGEAIEDNAKNRQAIWQKEAKYLQDGTFQWHQAGLGRPGLMANFDYWSKMAKFVLDEVTLLSLGLEPTAYFRERLDPDKMKRKNTCAEDEFATRRFEMFRRKFSHTAWDTTVYPKDLFEWVRSVRLDGHPAFMRMIDIIEARENSAAVPNTLLQETDAPDAERPPEGREVASLAKLLTAIAMEEYGYVPHNKRSPIPREIEGITDRHGLSVSKDTIRKYLQIGARYLPKQE